MPNIQPGDYVLFRYERLTGRMFTLVGEIRAVYGGPHPSYYFAEYHSTHDTGGSSCLRWGGTTFVEPAEIVHLSPDQYHALRSILHSQICPQN